MTHAEVYAFGEVLWDLLPTGRHPGGAPFNVCVHLSQFGLAAGLISAVGRDALGDELLAVAAARSVDTRFVTRARAGLSTGTVLAKLDRDRNASYEIAEPAAWDEIEVSDRTLELVQGSRALVYGSLAGRSDTNLERLQRLLELPGPVKLFDMNLRPPFADPQRVLELSRYAHVLKLNSAELGLLVSFVTRGSAPATTRDESEALGVACETLARVTGARKICVTRGAKGALWWVDGACQQVRAPAVEVRDTVGAGDAFMAYLTYGLIFEMPQERMLQGACKVGAFVASQHGATPTLPSELRKALSVA